MDWTKRITEIGLLMLTEEARRERIAALMDGHTIDGMRTLSDFGACGSLGQPAEFEKIYSEPSKTVDKHHYKSQNCGNGESPLKL